MFFSKILPEKRIKANEQKKKKMKKKGHRPYIIDFQNVTPGESNPVFPPP